jgi:hypothetical protein
MTPAAAANQYGIMTAEVGASRPSNRAIAITAIAIAVTIGPPAAVAVGVSTGVIATTSVAARLLFALMGGGAGAAAVCAGGRCNPTCFPAGTVVLTEFGWVAIETIEPGTMVWARDEFTGQDGWYEVLHAFGKHGAIITIDFDDGSSLRVTADHPMYVANGGFVNAGDLVAGDELVTLEGTVVVIAMQLGVDTVDVFNLEITDAHTYFVGDAGAWVHNAIYPSARQSPAFPANFVPLKGGTTKNNVKNGGKLDELRQQLPGQWYKVYRDGQVDNEKVSVHYFEHSSGAVDDVKVVPGWSNPK